MIVFPSSFKKRLVITHIMTQHTRTVQNSECLFPGIRCLPPLKFLFNKFPLVWITSSLTFCPFLLKCLIFLGFVVGVWVLWVAMPRAWESRNEVGQSLKHFEMLRSLHSVSVQERKVLEDWRWSLTWVQHVSPQQRRVCVPFSPYSQQRVPWWSYSTLGYPKLAGSVWGVVCCCSFS